MPVRVAGNDDRPFSVPLLPAGERRHEEQDGGTSCSRTSCASTKNRW